MEQWLVIGISGVTCSGKTTLATSLQKHFKERAGREFKAGIEINRVVLLNQDDYFRKEDDPKHQKIEKLNHLNWEIIESMDMDKMINDVMGILGKKFILYRTRSSDLVSSTHHENLFHHHFVGGSYQQKPRFHRGHDEMLFNGEEGDRFSYKLVKPNNLLNILIIEGFLIFNHPVLFDLCNTKFHLHVPYEVCYSRRNNRTYDPPDVPCYFEMVVWPFYEKHLREFKDREDVLFLNGEATSEKCFQYVLKSLIDEV